MSMPTASGGPRISARDISDEFAYIRRSTTDQFSEWRRGNYTWDAKKRKAEIAAIVHPKPGSWRYNTERTIDPDRGLLDTIRENRRIFLAGQASPGLDEGPLLNDPAYRVERVQTVQERGNLLDDRLVPVGFKQIRPLSTGGDSLVFLYTMEDQEARTHDIVVKVDPRQGSSSTNEIRVLKRLGGTRHIMQRLLLQAMPDPVRRRSTIGSKVKSLTSRMSALLSSSSSDKPVASRLGAPLSSAELRRVQEGRQDLDALDNVLVMEYTPNGNLGAWLAKFNQLTLAQKRYGERPPSVVLWSIFYCLAQGCIGMAYPSPKEDATVSQSIQMRQRFTVKMPEGDPVPWDPVVHFQLDLSNVYVENFGGADSRTHRHFPLVKISNFKLALFPQQEVKRRQDFQVEPWLWAMRGRGNKHCLLPEQTSEAWDYYAGWTGARDPIVGNYDSPSNVFHMGVIMWQLITGYEPEVPFMPRPYAEENKPDADCGWTFGHALLESRKEWDPDNLVPRPLLLTVARCMEYMPSRRPTLRQLVNIIEPWVWDADWDPALGTSEAMRVWSQRLFQNAASSISTIG